MIICASPLWTNLCRNVDGGSREAKEVNIVYIDTDRNLETVSIEVLGYLYECTRFLEIVGKPTRGVVHQTILS